MNLFQKIEFYYKRAQELPKYDHTIKQTINTALQKLLSRTDLDRQESNSFSQYLQESHPDQNSNWSAHLGKLMDQMNSLKRAAKTSKLANHYQEVYNILSQGWDRVEQQGGKAHTSKPLSEPWTGINNSLLPTSTSSRFMKRLNKFSIY